MNLTPNEAAFLISLFTITGAGLVGIIIYLANGILKKQEEISNNIQIMVVNNAISTEVMKGIQDDVKDLKEETKIIDGRVGTLEKKFAAIKI